MKKMFAFLLVLAIITAAVPAAFAQATVTQDTRSSVSTTDPGENPCRESDNGKDFWNRGVTKNLQEYKEDSCDGSVLFEYYCDDDQIQLTRYQCEFSCLDGRCVKDVPAAEPALPTPVPTRPVATYPVPSNDGSQKDLLERIQKLERRVSELEMLVKKLSSCCNRVEPQPVPAPVDPCSEKCADVKRRCFASCKQTAAGVVSDPQACELKCAREVNSCGAECDPQGRPEEKPRPEPRPLPPAQEPCAEKCYLVTADCKESCRKQYADLQTNADDSFQRKINACYQETCDPSLKVCLRTCEGGAENGGTATQILTTTPAGQPESSTTQPTATPAPPNGADQGGAAGQVNENEQRRTFFQWLFRR